ncbi:MAG: protein kinase [Planctomycetia bacterium]|nr:protein kinase [Planctomycetia bacterium]
MSIEPESVQAVFLAAVACDDSAQRAVVLERQCGDNAELRHRVVALLAAHDDPGELPRPGLLEPNACERPPDYAPGQVIARRYRLLEEIGEGGMGTVWVAQQIEPLRRQVAIKLIKPGMDSRRVLSRFETELQALALMDHAGIARVFDGGLTEAGRPFFVMEYVQGLPITEFCDRARMTVPERLTLFIEVCQAVHHAHQKGIIHRDLKPSNILVADESDRAVAKVIDFGLAKAMHEPVAEDSLPAAQSLIMGTPRYMSPEQAELNNLDIDTRTDVYSLGVILYQLLTGATPLASERFQEASLPEMLRLIKEDEPSRPSVRLAASDSVSDVADRRSAVPAQLRRAVRGDLDWIVMKALAKERSRRYESANDLTRDIERFLDHEPIAARPPSATYRMRKFASRHRLALIAGLLVSTTLVAGTITSSILAIQATRAEKVAEAALAEEARQRGIAEEQRNQAAAAQAAEAEQRQVAQQQRNEAERRRAEAEANFRQARDATKDYFFSIIDSKHLNVPALQPLRRELLDSALAYYRKFIDQHGDDPALEAELAYAYFSCGELYEIVGSSDRALEPLQEATQRYERLLKRQPASERLSREAASAYIQKGAVQQSTGRAVGADTSFRRAIEISESLAARSAGKADAWVDVARASTRLGGLRTTAGWFAEAEAPLVRAIEIYEKLSRAEPTAASYRIDFADACYRFCALLLATGRLDEAKAAILRAFDLYEQLLQEDPTNPRNRGRVAGAFYRFGEVERVAGELQNARASYCRALDLFEDLVREDPSQSRFRRSIGGIHFHIGLLQSAGGQREEAARSWTTALDDFRAAAKLAYVPPTLVANIAETLAQLDRWNEAASTLATSIDAGDFAWKRRCQLAFLEWMAGDTTAYRATCRELVSHHGSESTPLESTAIALVCLIDADAVENSSRVLEIAGQAAAADSSDLDCQALVGAAQYRAGKTHDALQTLERLKPLDESAKFSSTSQACAARANRLFGETILALIDRELAKDEACATRIEKLLSAIGGLRATALQYCDAEERWRIGLAVLFAERELARLKPAVDRAN